MNRNRKDLPVATDNSQEVVGTFVGVPRTGSPRTIGETDESVLLSSSLSSVTPLERKQQVVSATTTTTTTTASSTGSSHSQSFPTILQRRIRTYYQSTIAQVPPKYKWVCFLLWIAWKFVAVYGVYYFLGSSSSSTSAWWFLTRTTSRFPGVVWIPSIPLHPPTTTTLRRRSPPPRVLYIVTTTIVSYEEQDVSTDLYQALPLLRHNVASIVESGYHVDVVWILETSPDNHPRHEPTLSAETTDLGRLFQVIRHAFPAQVGISIWPQASPYEIDAVTGRLQLQHSQQHQAWWIIRDRFTYYHLFMVWPDTARIQGSNVHHFWTLSQQLLLLQQQQEKQQQQPQSNSNQTRQYHNPKQLRKFIPGFIPVFPHGHTAGTSTNHSAMGARHRVAQALQEHETVLHFSPQSILPLLSNQLTQGPMIPQDPSTTITTTSHWNNQTTNGPSLSRVSPTVVMKSPASSLHWNNGFLITRTQLAQNGLLECLFPPPSTADGTPILESNHRQRQEQQGRGENDHRRSCQPPRIGLFVADDIVPHLVQFVMPPHNQQQQQHRRSSSSSSKQEHTKLQNNDENNNNNITTETLGDFMERMDNLLEQPKGTVPNRTAMSNSVVDQGAVVTG